MRYAVHGNLPDTVDRPATPWRGRIEKMIRPVSASLAAAIADPLGAPRRGGIGLGASVSSEPWSRRGSLTGSALG
jgi:hypothetical protein